MSYILGNLSALASANTNYNQFGVTPRDLFHLLFSCGSCQALDSLLIQMCSTWSKTQRDFSVDHHSSCSASPSCYFSSCLGLPKLQCLLNSERLLGSYCDSIPGTMAYKVLWTVNWGNNKAHFICFPSLGHHYSVLPVVKCLKADLSYILFHFHVI